MKRMLLILLGATMSLTACNDAGEDPTEEFTQKQTSNYLDSVKLANTSQKFKDEGHWVGK